MRLEDLTVGAVVRGIDPDGDVTVVAAQWFGSDAVQLTYRKAAGQVADRLVYRDDEPRLRAVREGRPWSFDADGASFRLVAEALRIRLAHLFDPHLAVHTSKVDPLPHQITAVYESMLPRQPLRFLLADDPGAGKTIMAGLLIRELIARGDLVRCLVVCPGSLAEQWQDELWDRFHLPFEILTNDKLEASKTGNWFLETDLVIARLDQLSRNESTQRKLEAPDAGWDLVVCDEAHKMSASYFGREARYTKRYRLGQLLSGLTRHFLLMTATPHNGKEADFQLFMALLDGDRFEGRYRDDVHTTDVSDLMRRMVKERLLKFDGKPLFPERHAHTVQYQLSAEETELYAAVSAYVRTEFNRAEALANRKRAGTVGFALTVLQRRLASSPEAIYQSLRRRRERLLGRLRELETYQRGGQHSLVLQVLAADELDEEDFEDLEDAPEDERAQAEAQILDQATAAQSIEELKAELATLRGLEAQALRVRRAGRDTKWRELADLLLRPELNGQKLVVFTEHVDTLRYLEERIVTLIGRDDQVVTIHGGVGRDRRLKVQELFRHDSSVQLLLATDAAGEGINLQRAHLMVNYDLPWNPNRLEQRFGRIHRIGQTEPCRLWNLVADDTREGDVYRRLLEKLEEARKALGGQVFDVLGKLEFEGRPLRDLLLEAVRYGERPEVKARLDTVVDDALDRGALESLLEEKQLVQEAMDASALQEVRESMARAQARRLQPHYVRSFFEEAFGLLGGRMRQREPGRFEVRHVPGTVRGRDRLIGRGAPVLRQYERIAFEKHLVTPPGQPQAAFVCPGHPLLDSVLDLTLERDRSLLKRGTVLIDEEDPGVDPRVLLFLEHAIQDGTTTKTGERREISRQLLFVEMSAAGEARHLQYAPYLDLRPRAEGEPAAAEILALPECAWIVRDLEQRALAHAVAHTVPGHLAEVRCAKLGLIAKTRAAVKERLTKEMSHWDNRALELEAEERAGKVNARLNSQEARRRADDLQARLQRRERELDLEEQISPRPPVALGGALVVPQGLLDRLQGRPTMSVEVVADRQRIAARARKLVMEAEQRLGFEPIDVETEKRGYDIESRDPGSGETRFLEVKGRRRDADTISVTKNEVLYSLNSPKTFILAIVLFDESGGHEICYVREPFEAELELRARSATYDLGLLLKKGGPPT